ncbi:MAG: AAA family ATPase [Sutterellaceae bacterium]|nr:AAA family ATPase [Sutterellaceae bacterium]MDD7441767.1 AAA family ATPase [Sutterellaceae bacterium]MDY2867506.1 AAA family ATPase [Mesosutterella sp.]
MIDRWAMARLRMALEYERIACVIGPRQCGKTTLVENVPIKGSDLVSLGLDANLEAAKWDPRFFISRYKGKCLIIDEIQKAPFLIGEIKYTVDHDDRPGQFLLTGSSDYRRLPHATESLAGRVDIVRLRTFTTAERMGKKPRFLERLFEGDFSFSIDRATTGKEFALREAINGGYPGALRRSGSEEAREAWFRNQVEQHVITDMKEQWAIRREDLVRTLFPCLAAFSGKPFNVLGVSRKLGANWKTLTNYVGAMRAMSIVDELPAWTALGRDAPGKAPKLFMTDSGLMASILGIRNAEKIIGNPGRNATEQVGKLVETWAYNQIVPEADLHPMWQMFHLRTRSHEIDFLVSGDCGDMLGIEVKASQSVNETDFRHLFWFGEQAHSGKFTGIVLYAGSEVLSFGNNCYAVPFASLWSD